MKTAEVKRAERYFREASDDFTSVISASGNAIAQGTYYPAALRKEICKSSLLAAERRQAVRSLRVYQVLALLGWAAAVAMGVFDGL